MNKNGFTLPLTLFCLSLVLIILSSTLYVYNKQIQFEVKLTQYYKKKAEKNLETLLK